MNVIFAGTPDIAVPSLEAAMSCANVCAVLTNPDSPAGRGKRLVASPIKTKALERGIPVLQPEKLDQEFRNQVLELKPDLLISFAYGKIFGPKTLSCFSFGGINIHPSLLPKYRGPAPINAAILNMDEYTGISIQKLAEEMDSGDILLQNRIRLNHDETTEVLSRIVSFISAEMLVEVLENFQVLSVKAYEQKEEDASYCHILKKEDGLIDWNLSSKEISAKIRAYFPWPGSFTFVDSQRLNILAADLIDDSQLNEKYSSEEAGKVLEINKSLGIIVKTGDSLLGIKQLQLHSKKVLDFRSFSNGFCLKDKKLG
ncbi:MAG: methionyl-tRNA formyltransferase [Spirochaetales bacterium]|nr:methionyl-tRNA formyltransferase [Spirochaetales bacterium]